MNEKIYKTITGSGAASLVMGILTVTTGIVTVCDYDCPRGKTSFMQKKYFTVVH